MRNTILLFLLLLCGVGKYAVRAQSYIPIPDSNAYWRVTDGSVQEMFFTDSVTNDTVIGPNNYTELFYYFSNNIYAGCFRNDTTNKKVFYIPPDSLQEYLLYDFSANVGDTVNVIAKSISFPAIPTSFQIISLVVDSIKGKVIGPRIHKRMYLSNTIVNDYAIWTEGVGNIYNGILNYKKWNATILFCMSSDDTVRYFNNFISGGELNYFLGSCDTMEISLGVTNNNYSTDVIVHPTVVSSQLHVTSINKGVFPVKIEIIDMLGRSSDLATIDEDSILSTSMLTSGLYIVKIYSNHFIISTHKIIKQ